MRRRARRIRVTSVAAAQQLPAAPFQLPACCKKQAACLAVGQEAGDVQHRRHRPLGQQLGLVDALQPRLGAWQQVG